MAVNMDGPAADRGGRGTEGRTEEYPLGVIAASVGVVNYGVTVHGWCVAESTGAAGARIRIRDGRDATGSVIGPVSVVANGTSAIWLGEDGLAAETGIFMEVISGSVEVTLYLCAPLHPRGS